jgi:hypothetical protein
MSETQTGAQPRPTSFARFGLSHAALAAMIAAELEQAEDGSDPEAIASAVATAMEANNQELLRQLNQLLSADLLSAPLAGGEAVPPEP